MGAPKENQFWKLRSKHGRDKLFESSELLWEAVCEYFQWCEDNPLIEAQIVKGNRVEETTLPTKDKEGKNKNVKAKTTIPYDIAHLPKMRPFTMQGLCHYLGCNTGYFNDFSRSLKDKEGESDKDFSAIITRIRETVYRQKFEGAASGFLNANLIARDLGLADKKDHTINQEQPLFGDD